MYGNTDYENKNTAIFYFKPSLQQVTDLLHVLLQATDPDEGLNADIRYQILGRIDDESRKFVIDPITGQVRSIVSFGRDAGCVYGFDVKATDKRGADDGKSAITNVFVSVL